MRINRSIAPYVAGILTGIALTLSCGDDSPGNADAATCDCPAAEPSIAGRVVVVDGTQTIAANSDGVAGTECPEGAQMLSGSCTTDTFRGYDVTLQQSGFYGSEAGSWNCTFKNNEPTPVTVKASVICLMPAP